ncbi:thioredoxin domain-containing protein [Streptomyces sodiiphilus]|uniref:Thioredoxin domain-containing protein n=1 Tax=Streptomyces sodiiphilus TaxID=226217 RepID=A0ABP5AKA8_9ACTN
MVRGGWPAAGCAAVLLVLAGCGRPAAEPEPVPKAGADVRAGAEEKATEEPAGLAPYTSTDELPQTLGADGTTIMVGDPDAALTIHMYEDLRCPVAQEFEATGGQAVRRDLMRRETKAEYTLASFMDDNLGGTGSAKAANALRAALEEEKFLEYLNVLFVHQPEGGADGFTDARLLELAGQVKGLRGPEFDAAVHTMKYRDFVSASQQAYLEAGESGEPEGPGTPTVLINDKRIPDQVAGVLYDHDVLGVLLWEIRKDPQRWETTPL